MYFVVHLLKSGKHIVVPKTWIQSIDEHWEKFVNKSINRNQKFLCFYSERGEAMNEEGKPNSEFVPNFSLCIDPDFPNDGCYMAKLILYKGKSFKLYYKLSFKLNFHDFFYSFKNLSMRPFKLFIVAAICRRLSTMYVDCLNYPFLTLIRPTRLCPSVDEVVT